MKRLFLLLVLLPAIAHAIPTCPAYTYHDFVWASNYAPPVRPADSLIDNCRNLNLVDRTVCDRLGNLTTDQQKILITDNLVRNNGFPDLNASKSWNYALQFTKYPPDNTTVVNSNNIRNAWVRVLSLTPSVLESSTNQLLINDTGELYSQASLSFVINRQTFSGDCRTDYAVCGYNYAVQSYNNGLPIGTGTKSTFTVPQVPNSSNMFTSTLSANSEYLIHHYQLVTHCYGTGTSTFCVTTCDYSGSDDIRDSVTASDSKTAYYYGFNHSEKSMVDSFKDGLLDGWLYFASNNDFGSSKLSFGNSWLKTQNQQYHLAYSLAPYNILTPEAFFDSKIQSYNLVLLRRETAANATIYSEKTHFQVYANSTNCTLEINSHFGAWKNDSFCQELNQTPIIALGLANLTNNSFELKVRFYDNITGTPFAGKNISLTYAGITQTAITDSLGEATVQFNYTKTTSLVKAVFLTDFQVKSASAILVLPAREPDFFVYLFYLVISLLVAYLLYKLTRRLLS